ncbi:MAG: pyruvate kinase [Bacteroidota bacterium]|jgi:pyruvate kinase
MHFQKTKIVATVGPSCNTREKLEELVDAGVDVFRLNFSHGTHEQHLSVIQHIHAINKSRDLYLGILADLQGPKLRVGVMEDPNGLAIKEGDILTFVQHECLGNAQHIYMSYEYFAQDVKPGEAVLVDDGNVQLEVVETNGVDTVQLVVKFGTVLKSKKGVNLPNTQVSQPSLTEKDIADLDFLMTLDYDVHWIALSFVRRPEDIDDLRTRIVRAQHEAKIIAKIEKPEAVDCIEEIVKRTDAVMVARGDLGVEMPIEEVPLVQKLIVNLCNKYARPVIVATQMMESMIKNPMPTRAETTDVANAVFDGADAVMLSGETASGDHPALVVSVMRRIIGQAETSDLVYNKQHKPDASSSEFVSDVVCHNAHTIAREVNSDAIIGFTVSGYTAFQVSSYRPKANIYIFSDKRHALSMLNLVWGVRPFWYRQFAETLSTNKTIHEVHAILKEKGIIKTGDVIVNTGAMPLDAKQKTNLLRVGIAE